MKLVVGYVNNEEGKAALQWAADHARLQGDEVIIVHSIRGGGSEEEEQKEVLVMRHYSNMSFKEIADVTNVSINTALGRMRYALINLRKIVKEKNLVLSA